MYPFFIHIKERKNAIKFFRIIYTLKREASFTLTTTRPQNKKTHKYFTIITDGLDNSKTHIHRERWLAKSCQYTRNPNLTVTVLLQVLKRFSKDLPTVHLQKQNYRKDNNNKVFFPCISFLIEFKTLDKVSV